jgi:uncharacterized lipoprotein YddW (UPF0748 family)
MHNFLLLCAAMLLSVGQALLAQTELRAVWVARDGLTSRQKIQTTLDQLRAANVNVVCVNVWSRGYTIHPSDVLFAACGQRQDPDYVGRDPLREFLDEAHRRGIEVEAWFEYGFLFGWSGWYAGPLGLGPVLTANPAWRGMDQTGSSLVADGNGGTFAWASHEHPGVRQFLLDLVDEVVANYDLDGVQLDRIRYPSTSFGYDPATVAAYQAATGQNPPANPNQAAWKRWRADRLTAFHGECHARIKLRRPTVRVGNAPTVMPGAYDNFLQDWPAWLVAGSLDLVYPQVYRTTLATYTTTLDQQLAAVRPIDRHKLAPGIRAITGTPTTEVLGMVAANRQRGLPGHVFWYAEGLYDDLPALQQTHFQQPAAVPGRPAGWRPAPTERDDSHPSTVRSAGFVAGYAVGAIGNTAAISLPTATAQDRVTYHLPVAETGLWSLRMHVPTAAGFSAAAPVVVAHAAGHELVHVDQTLAEPTGWRDLGLYWLPQGTTTVAVGAVPGRFVAADAMALWRARWGGGAMVALGQGTVGSAGVAELSLTGNASPGGTLRLQIGKLAAHAPALLTLGFQPAATPWFGGTLLVSPAVSLFAAVGADGRASLDLTLPLAAAWRGVSLYGQAVGLDPQAVGGAQLSNAVATTLL